MMEEPTKVHVTDIIEHPYITEEEAGVLEALKPVRPDIQTNWFYVPAIAGPCNSRVSKP
jgi:ABC-type uncharacterized transport system substrate-binding protein